MSLSDDLSAAATVAVGLEDALAARVDEVAGLVAALDAERGRLSEVQASFDDYRASHPDATPDPGPEPEPEPDPDPEPLTWAAPTLENPTVIKVSATNKSFNKLDPAKDYILEMPGAVVDVGTGRISITGGRNVVMFGGEITGTGVDGTIRATGQTGTLHIEGVLISGGSLQEGIQLQNMSAATVQIQRCRIERVSGSYSGHHADLLQWWGGGPKVLRIDRFTGSTDYQGMMMQNGPADASAWDWRRINIRHEGSAGWTLFDAAPKVPAIGHVSDVYLSGTAGNAVYSSGKGKAPAGVTLADPPGGDWCPEGLAGIGYAG